MTAKKLASVQILRRRDVGADGEDVGFGLGLVGVVEADRAVDAEKVGVAGFCGVQAFDAISAAACGHLSFAIQNQINFFGVFVMVRKIRACGGEVHEEEVGDGVGGVDAIAFGDARADHQFVENGGGVAANGLFLEVAEVGDGEIGRGC